ncbi:peptide-methionine (S)-S-oxide reductase MsrA [Salaquimonas pukyongi]|uniref:peptide-methionine (S)-S-oxide reductase MsrA n=1 Tax=Salaquimonas pukyongi TaxID=2712698 RepID=UPI00096BA60D|nr:peptide-methionine (S)-S-oxide reductase MsrA [Salaquimonas pukyongi]
MNKIAAIVKVGLVCAGMLVSSGSPARSETATAILAGGCFWCIESDFEQVEGVVDVVSGYTGGETDNPTYKNHVKAGHLEAVRITYDTEKTSYAELLETFWRTVDPTDAGGQFCDRGNSYTTAIFVADALEREMAEASRQEAQEALGKPIVTPVLDAAPFYLAETYHQDYYKKNPKRYKYYRWACGRNQRVKALWGEHAYQGVADH